MRWLVSDRQRAAWEVPREAAGQDAASELLLLGGFVFSVGGDALLGITAYSQRLLAVLTLRHRLVTRVEVAGTLWPESSDEQAGLSLRSAVSRLDRPTRQAVKVTAVDLYAWAEG